MRSVARDWDPIPIVELPVRHSAVRLRTIVEPNSAALMDTRMSGSTIRSVSVGYLPQLTPDLSARRPPADAWSGMAGATGFEPVAFGFGVGETPIDNPHQNTPTFVESHR